MYDRPAMQTRYSADVPAAERAEAYALLANGWREPDEAFVQLLRRSGFAHDGPALMQGLSTDENNLRAAFARLFGHTVRGTCPPYELEYGRSEIIQQTAELADLAGFYQAFGMGMNISSFERPDHVSVECEFLSVLCAKEAWGEQQGHSELVERCADALRLFLRDHLGKWFPAFAHRVMKSEPGSFYGRLAEYAAAFIAEECRRFDIQVGPQWLELRPADPERDASIDCESAGCGAGVGEQFVQIGMDRQRESKPIQ